MVKLAIFDLDGTLLNTLADIVEACNHALRDGGFSAHTTDEYLYLIGHGPIYLVEQALPEANRDEATVLKTYERYLVHYSEHSQDLTKPYDGIIDALKAIRKTGTSVAVYSNKSHANVVELCGVYFDGLVDMAVGFRDGAKPKPDPEIGFEIMRHFSSLPHETVYIGDSGVDMETGKRLGVFTVGVSWGFRPKKELKDCGADVIIDKACELVNFFVDK